MKQIIFKKNENGYTFVIALFVVAFISILGLGLMTLTTNTLNTTKHERDDQSTFYIAEAGLNVEKEEIYTTINNAYDWVRDKHKNTKIEDRDNIDFVDLFIKRIEDELPTELIEYQNFRPQFNKQPEACIKVELLSINPFKITIESTGYLLKTINSKVCPDNIIKPNRVVEQIVEVDLNLKFLNNIDSEVGDGSISGLSNLAVQTTGDIKLDGGSKIVGSAVTNTGTIHFTGDTNITGAIGTSKPLDAPDYLITQNKLKERLVDIKVPEILLPEFPSNTFTSLASASYPSDFPLNNGNYAYVKGSKEFFSLTENAKIKSFSVPDGETITIDIGDRTVNLLVEETFSIGSNATVNIKGNGKLNIFVKNSLTLIGTLGTMNRDPNNINVYFAGISTPKIDDGGSLIAASLYVEKSDLTFAGGGGISGNIISGGKNITIDNGRKPTGQYILAPNAKVSLGGDYKGVIIAQSYLGKYGIVTYAPGIVPPPFLPTIKPDYSDNDDLIKDGDLIEK